MLSKFTCRMEQNTIEVFGNARDGIWKPGTKQKEAMT